VDQAELEEVPEAVPVEAASLLAAFLAEVVEGEVKTISLEGEVAGPQPQPHPEEEPRKEEAQQAVALGVEPVEVPQVDALEVAVVAA